MKIAFEQALSAIQPHGSLILPITKYWYHKVCIHLKRFLWIRLANLSNEEHLT